MQLHEWDFRICFNTPKQRQPSRLGLQKIPTASLQNGKTCKTIDIKQSDAEGSSNAGALGNVEYLFIAIAPKSTLVQSGSIW